MITRREVIKNISISLVALTINPIKLTELFPLQEQWKPPLPYKVSAKQFNYGTEIGVAIKIEDKKYGFIFPETLFVENLNVKKPEEWEGEAAKFLKQSIKSAFGKYNEQK